jgi:hypothetical protein
MDDYGQLRLENAVLREIMTYLTSAELKQLRTRTEEMKGVLGTLTLKMIDALLECRASNGNVECK